MVSHVLHASVGDLGDVYQTIFARQNVDECTEIGQTNNFTFIDAVHFDLGGDGLDATDRFHGGFVGHGGDTYSTVIIQLDVGAGLFGQRTDHGTTLTDHVLDLLRIDLDGVDTRCKIGDLGTGSLDSFVHHFQDVQTSTTSLLQSNLHDLFGDAFDLDVHLQRGHTFGGTGYFEVHVAQVIFVTQNVGQHDETFFFLHQTHGDTGNGGLDRHTGIHQRQRGTTDRRHGGGTVGFGNFRDHAYHVRELGGARHHGSNAALGQTAVTDFTTLRATHHAGLTDTVWREVVVQHEAIGTVAGQLVDVLGITLGPQSGDHDGLSFTTGEQGRTVGTGQYAGTYAQGADHFRIATIDTRLTTYYATTNDAAFQAVELFADLLGIFFHAGSDNLLNHTTLDGRDGFVTNCLLGDAVGFTQFGARQLGNLGFQRFVDGRRSPVPRLGADGSGKLVDRIDHGLHLLVTVYHGAQHHFFGKDGRFGLNHQHGIGSTGNYQIQIALRQFGGGRVQHILTVHVTHASSTDRAAKRDTGDGQCSRGTDHGNDVGGYGRIHGHYGRNDLNLIEEAFREQRTNRTVDQTGDEGLAFARTAFTTEETTRDTTSSIGTLLVVDGQREEITAVIGLFLADYGHKYAGIVHADHNGRSGLTGHHTGFQSDGVLTVLE